MRSRRSRLASAAATTVMLAAACTTSNDRASAPLPSTGDDHSIRDVLPSLETLPPAVRATAPTTAASTTTVPRLPSPASADVVRQSRRYSSPEPVGPLARSFGLAPTLLPPGEHHTDVLGVDLTLRLNDWWQLARELYGTVQLTPADAPIGRQLPTVLFERPVGLADPSRVADGNLVQGEYPVPPQELETWFTDVEQIDVLATGDAVAGDRTGRWYEIVLDPSARRTLDDCSPGRCVFTSWAGATVTVVVRENEVVRYYEFPDPGGPIFVLVAVAPDARNWFDVADELIRNTTFGPSAPHPVPDGVSFARERIHDPGETWRFAQFPGVVLEAAERSISRQQPGYLGFEPWGPAANVADSAIVRPLQNADGDPLETIDDVIGELTASGLTRLADEEVVGRTAAVFEGVAHGPIFRRMPVEPGDLPDFVQWPEHVRVRVWAFESPVGPLLVTAEADGTGGLPTGIRHAELLMESLTFDCAADACTAAES